MKIANGLAQKPNFSGYTWIDDMKMEGILTTLKYISNFDPDKSNNPFAYITTIISNSFIGYITKQKKHSKLKNDLFDAKDKFVEFDQSLAEKDRAIDYRQMIN